MDGTRQPILYSFGLSSSPEQIVYNEPRVKLFKEVNKSVLSDRTFYLEDDDYKPVDSQNETISFTCHLTKI